MRTLGLFAKKPEPGQVKTRLAADIGAAQAARLYEAFVRDLLERFAEIGDQRIVGFSPDTDDARAWFASASGETWNLWCQPRSILGERIAAFFASHLKSESDRVILVGSDSPTVPAEYLGDAWRQLETCDCVIGPASDGGYWLIGLSGRASNWQRLFEEIDWSSSRVLQQTVDRIRESRLSLGLLPVWYDVDSLDDLEQLTGHISATATATGSCPCPRLMDLLARRFEG